MKARLTALLLCTCLLASCTTPQWGTYATLTPPGPSPAPPPSSTFTPPPSPSPSPTATPQPIPTATATLPPQGPPLSYYTQVGDWLPAVALRFAVDPGEIIANSPLPADALLEPGTLLVIPARLGSETTPGSPLLPDSEVVFSPAAVGFDVQAYVTAESGYLSTFREYLSSGWASGAQAVERSALENSINPRLLLALLEFESGWVTGSPSNLAQTDYPLGHNHFYYRGLFRQLMWAVQQLSVGYYGWRNGQLTELTFPDGSRLRLAPELNAGTVAVYYYFAQTRNQADWVQAVDPASGFPALLARMFGDPWARAVDIFPPGLSQPPMSLPYAVGQTWAYTGGPHSAWGADGALAALDFAPPTGTNGCLTSDMWALAAAPGLVVRSGNGVVVLDLDGDGYEQTGWSLLYLHIASAGRVALGTWVERDDPIGHPSCEGGRATGTHLHIARKYNGEWVLADGPLPFNLSGWVAANGERPYKGALVKGDRVAIANENGTFETLVTREGDE
jgi:LasA protease